MRSNRFRLGQPCPYGFAFCSTHAFFFRFASFGSWRFPWWCVLFLTSPAPSCLNYSLGFNAIASNIEFSQLLWSQWEPMKYCLALLASFATLVQAFMTLKLLHSAWLQNQNNMDDLLPEMWPRFLGYSIFWGKGWLNPGNHFHKQSFWSRKSPLIPPFSHTIFLKEHFPYNLVFSHPRAFSGSGSCVLGTFPVTSVESIQ